MSANVTSARGTAGYFGREFLDQCRESGGEPRLYGPRTRALGTEAVTAEAALERALTDGFLERRQANVTPGWVVTLTAPKDWLLAVNATHGPEEAKRVHSGAVGSSSDFCCWRWSMQWPAAACTPACWRCR